MAENDIVAFGMTEKQIIDTAEALARQTDTNHPEKSGTYTDFLAAVNSGREMLRKNLYFGGDYGL